MRGGRVSVRMMHLDNGRDNKTLSGLFTTRLHHSQRHHKE